MSDHTSAETPRDYDTPVARWQAEIAKSEKEYDPWWRQARGITSRYRDERAAHYGAMGESSAGAKMNLLWSNVQTLAPAVYAATPKPMVQRRYGDEDDVGRVASTILKRAVSVQLDQGDFDETARGCVLDHLLAGRGTVWLRYEPRFTSTPPGLGLGLPSPLGPSPASPPLPGPVPLPPGGMPPPSGGIPTPTPMPIPPVPAGSAGAPPLQAGASIPPPPPPIAPSAQTAGGAPLGAAMGAQGPPPPLGGGGSPPDPLGAATLPPTPPPPPPLALGPMPIGSLLDNIPAMGKGGGDAAAGKDDDDGGLQVADDGTQGATETIAWESVAIDHVAWQDWLSNPARTWAEVRWVARRVYMTRDEIAARFGKKLADEVPLDWHPSGLSADEAMLPANQIFCRAQVFEIWDKPSRRVVWIAAGYTDDVLDEVDDPLHLEGFFPTPKPVFATMTTDTLVPVPDFHLYRDQAEEIDGLTARIHAITKAIKVAGVYDASADGVQRMFAEGVENQLIPINQWMSFSEKGGLKGSLDMLDISTFAEVLAKLVEIRAQAKQDLYEVTGISDIIRGTTAASETATAQQIKSQFGTMRLRDRQGDVARFCRDIVRLVAEIVAEHFTPRTLIAISGITNQPDEAPFVADAIALLKDEKTRGLRIDIETDSTVLADQQAEQQSRVQFVQMAGQFLQQAGPAVEQSPAIAPLLGKMLLFAIRAFPAAAELEGAFEQAVKQMEAAVKAGAGQPQQPGPDPKMLVAQAQVQDIQSKIADRQHDNQLADAQAQAEHGLAAAKLGIHQQAEADKSQRDTVTMFHDHAASRADTFLDAAKIAMQARAARDKGAA